MITNRIQEAERLAADGTEGGRRPTGVPSAADSKSLLGGEPVGPKAKAPQPNPQVVETPVRRRYSKAYKQRILQQIAVCTKDGEVGEILRREGLYSSLVSCWRKKEKQGQLKESGATKQLASPVVQDPSLPQLQRENARLQARLQKAELILEIQKKASEILGISLKTLDSERSD